MAKKKKKIFFGGGGGVERVRGKEFLKEKILMEILIY